MRDSPDINLTIKVEGAEELFRAAERAGVQSRDLRRLNTRLARPIVRLAKSRCPKGKTGKLRASIRPKRSRVSVTILSQGLPYASVVHWGRDGESGPKYIKTAMDEHVPRVIEGINQGIKDLINDQGL